MATLPTSLFATSAAVASAVLLLPGTAAARALQRADLTGTVRRSEQDDCTRWFIGCPESGIVKGTGGERSCSGGALRNISTPCILHRSGSLATFFDMSQYSQILLPEATVDIRDLSRIDTDASVAIAQGVCENLGLWQVATDLFGDLVLPTQDDLDDGDFEDPWLGGICSSVLGTVGNAANAAQNSLPVLHLGSQTTSTQYFAFRPECVNSNQSTGTATLDDLRGRYEINGTCVSWFVGCPEESMRTDVNGDHVCEKLYAVTSLCDEQASPASQGRRQEDGAQAASRFLDVSAGADVFINVLVIQVLSGIGPLFSEVAGELGGHVVGGPVGGLVGGFLFPGIGGEFGETLGAALGSAVFGAGANMLLEALNLPDPGQMPGASANIESILVTVLDDRGVPECSDLFGNATLRTQRSDIPADLPLNGVDKDAGVRWFIGCAEDQMHTTPERNEECQDVYNITTLLHPSLSATTRRRRSTAGATGSNGLVRARDLSRGVSNFVVVLGNLLIENGQELGEAAGCVLGEAAGTGVGGVLGDLMYPGVGALVDTASALIGATGCALGGSLGVATGTAISAAMGNMVELDAGKIMSVNIQFMGGTVAFKPVNHRLPSRAVPDPSRTIEKAEYGWYGIPLIWQIPKKVDVTDVLCAEFESGSGSFTAPQGIGAFLTSRNVADPAFLLRKEIRILFVDGHEERYDEYESFTLELPMCLQYYNPQNRAGGRSSRSDAAASNVDPNLAAVKKVAPGLSGRYYQDHKCYHWFLGCPESRMQSSALTGDTGCADVHILHSRCDATVSAGSRRIGEGQSRLFFDLSTLAEVFLPEVVESVLGTAEEDEWVGGQFSVWGAGLCDGCDLGNVTGSTVGGMLIPGFVNLVAAVTSPEAVPLRESTGETLVMYTGMTPECQEPDAASRRMTASDEGFVPLRGTVLVSGTCYTWFVGCPEDRERSGLDGRNECEELYAVTVLCDPESDDAVVPENRRQSTGGERQLSRFLDIEAGIETFLPVFAAAMIGYTPDIMEAVGGAVGSAAGGFVGGQLGGLIGGILLPGPIGASIGASIGIAIGTALGAAVGGAVGGAVGSVVGGMVQDQLYEMLGLSPPGASWQVSELTFTVVDDSVEAPVCDTMEGNIAPGADGNSSIQLRGQTSNGDCWVLGCPEDSMVSLSDGRTVCEELHNLTIDCDLDNVVNASQLTRIYDASTRSNNFVTLLGESLITSGVGGEIGNWAGLLLGPQAVGAVAGILFPGLSDDDEEFAGELGGLVGGTIGSWLGTAGIHAIGAMLGIRPFELDTSKMSGMTMSFGDGQSVDFRALTSLPRSSATTTTTTTNESAEDSATPRRRTTFYVGQRVEAQRPSRRAGNMANTNVSVWYPGTVMKANADASFAVKFDDRHREELVAPETNMRVLERIASANQHPSATSCPNKQKAYRVKNAFALTWDQARDHCRATALHGQQGELAQIRDGNHQRRMMNTLGKRAGAFDELRLHSGQVVQYDGYWTGGNSIGSANGNEWSWSGAGANATEFGGYENWLAEAPGLFARGNPQQCMQLTVNWAGVADLQWDDMACSARRRFVCEYCNAVPSFVSNQSVQVNVGTSEPTDGTTSRRQTADVAIWVDAVVILLNDDGTFSVRFEDGSEAVSPPELLRAVGPVPTSQPSAEPTTAPTSVPTATPTDSPTAAPTANPTDVPTVLPTAVPTAVPTGTPTQEPTVAPTQEPTILPTATPTSVPTTAPTASPTAGPTAAPTQEPTVLSTAAPTALPTATHSSDPSTDAALSITNSALTPKDGDKSVLLMVVAVGAPLLVIAGLCVAVFALLRSKRKQDEPMGLSEVETEAKAGEVENARVAVADGMSESDRGSSTQQSPSSTWPSTDSSADDFSASSFLSDDMCHEL